MPKPTVYNARVHAQIVEHLRAGAFRKHAAEAAGVSFDAMDEWVRAGLAGDARYEQFAIDVRTAMAEDAVRNVRVITKAAVGEHKGDWKAAAWNLEKKFPLLYGSMPRGHHEDHRSGEKVFSPWKQSEATTTTLGTTRSVQ